MPSENGEKSEAESDAAASPAEEATDEDEEENDDDDSEEEEAAAAEAADKEAEAGTTTASNHKNPNAVQATPDPTDLSVWGMVRTLWGWLRSDLSESLFGADDDDEKPASGSSAVGESPSLKNKNTKEEQQKKTNIEQNKALSFNTEENVKEPSYKNRYMNYIREFILLFLKELKY